MKGKGMTDPELGKDFKLCPSCGRRVRLIQMGGTYPTRQVVCEMTQILVIADNGYAVFGYPLHADGDYCKGVRG